MVGYGELCLAKLYYVTVGCFSLGYVRLGYTPSVWNILFKIFVSIRGRRIHSCQYTINTVLAVNVLIAVESNSDAGVGANFYFYTFTAYPLQQIPISIWLQLK
jgi:hypothetical protein